MEGPEIFKSEVKSVLGNMDMNKAEGPDGTVILMISTLVDSIIKKITE